MTMTLLSFEDMAESRLALRWERGGRKGQKTLRLIEDVDKQEVPPPPPPPAYLRNPFCVSIVCAQGRIVFVRCTYVLVECLSLRLEKVGIFHPHTKELSQN